MTYERFILPAKNKWVQSAPQRWADLGCGEGAFTELLAGILPYESEIFAWDKSSQRLSSTMGNNVTVQFQKVDFEKQEIDLANLDGILMANSFHYIHDKEKLIQKLETGFSNKKQFLIVEYDTNLANPWVPFPINFEKLKELFYKLGYGFVEKLNVRKSAYGGEMYIVWVHQ